MIIRNNKPRLVGVSKGVEDKDGHVTVESFSFQPGNNVVTLEKGKWLATIPAFKEFMKIGLLSVVSKGDTSPEDLRAGLEGIYSTLILRDLKKDPAYETLKADIDKRMEELVAPPKKD